MFITSFVRQCIHSWAFISQHSNRSWFAFGKWAFLRHAGVWWLLCQAVTNTYAIQIQRVETDVFVSGDIVANDDVKLRAEFDAAPVKRLILVNSRGGHLTASLNIAH